MNASSIPDDNPAEWAAIAQTQNRYASAIDSLNWDDLRACFTETTEVDYGATGTWSSREPFVAWAADFHERLRGSLHQMSSHVVHVSGQRATASCYGHALLVGLPGNGPTHTYGRYVDELERTGAGWLIARRTYHPFHRESRPE